MYREGRVIHPRLPKSGRKPQTYVEDNLNLHQEKRPNLHRDNHLNLHRNSHLNPRKDRTPNTTKNRVIRHPKVQGDRIHRLIRHKELVPAHKRRPQGPQQSLRCAAGLSVQVLAEELDF